MAVSLDSAVENYGNFTSLVLTYLMPVFFIFKILNHGYWFSFGGGFRKSSTWFLFLRLNDPENSIILYATVFKSLLIYGISHLKKIAYKSIYSTVKPNSHQTSKKIIFSPLLGFHLHPYLHSPTPLSAIYCVRRDRLNGKSLLAIFTPYCDSKGANLSHYGVQFLD